MYRPIKIVCPVCRGCRVLMGLNPLKWYVTKYKICKDCKIKEEVA